MRVTSSSHAARRKLMTEHATKGAVVFVIDDDASIRSALKELFETVGLKTELYASGTAFLENRIPDTLSCMVLDVRLPGTSGIQFQKELEEADVEVPIVFVTAHGDIAMAVRAMKAGAVDFLTKPFSNQDMLDAVFAALQHDRVRREKQKSHSTLREYFETLSSREREVLAAVSAGYMNKQIAAELGLSEVTVKVHRANAMRKMHARSLADLVRMTELLGIAKPATMGVI